MDELDQLRKLAGINEFKGYVTYNPEDPMGGSNISLAGNEKAEIMKRDNIKPGTEEWFKLWFSLPKLTGSGPSFRGRSK
jgi:hypothetical protein